MFDDFGPVDLLAAAPEPAFLALVDLAVAGLRAVDLAEDPLTEVGFAVDDFAPEAFGAGCLAAEDFFAAGFDDAVVLLAAGLAVPALPGADFDAVLLVADMAPLAWLVAGFEDAGRLSAVVSSADGATGMGATGVAAPAPAAAALAGAGFAAAGRPVRFCAAGLLGLDPALRACGISTPLRNWKSKLWRAEVV